LNLDDDFNNSSKNSSSEKPSRSNSSNSSQFSTPTKFPYRISEDSEGSEQSPNHLPQPKFNANTNITPVNYGIVNEHSKDRIPFPNLNFNFHPESVMGGFTNATPSNNITTSVTVTPSQRKSSEIGDNDHEPAPKKQKKDEKTPFDLNYWTSKSVPANKEEMLKDVSPIVQCRIIRKITKEKITWLDVDPMLIQQYKKKIEEKAKKLKELSSSSCKWFWMNECKVYFSRNKDGELIGCLELTSPHAKQENR